MGEEGRSQAAWALKAVEEFEFYSDMLGRYGRFLSGENEEIWA